MEPEESGEGQEFKAEDATGWLLFSPAVGDVLEVELSSSNLATATEEWSGFLVMGHHLDGEGGAVFEVKSLRGVGDALGKNFSGIFNRKVGFIHLCPFLPCLNSDCAYLHVCRLRWFTLAGFSSKVSASTMRQAQKWLENLRATGDKPMEDEVIEAEREHGRDGQEKRAEKERKSDPKKAVSAEKMQELREKLKAAKAKHGEAGDPGDPPHSEDSHQTVSSSSSESSSEENAEKRRAAEVLRRGLEHGQGLGTGTRISGQAAIRDGTSKDYAGQLIRMITARTQREKIEGDPHHGRAGKDPRQLDRQLLKAASKPPGGSPPGSSSSSSSKGGKKKKKDKKRKRSRSGSGKRPIRPSGSKPSGGKSKKKKKKKRKKKKKKSGAMRHSGRSSPSDSSQASSSSSTPSMEAPLRRKAQKRPGSVLALLVEHITRQLEQAATLDVPGGAASITSGIKITTYLSLLVKPQFPTHGKELREMHTLAVGLDALRRGDVARVGDILSSRFVAIHQSLLDGSWSGARFLEVEPMADASALGDGILLQARRHNKLVQKVQSPTPLWSNARKRQRSQDWFLVRVAKRRRWMATAQGKREREESWQEGKVQARERAEGERVEGDIGQAGRKVKVTENLGPLVATAPAFGNLKEVALQRGIRLWHDLIPRLCSLKAVGCALAWVLVQVESIGHGENSFRLWCSIFEKSCATRKGLDRPKGAIFPLRSGKLDLLRTELQRSTLEEVLSESFVTRCGVEAWTWCCFVAIQLLAGPQRPLSGGTWTSLETRAFDTTREAVRRFLALDVSHKWTSEQLRADFAEKQVSYTGEEQRKMHKLTYNQVIAALPPVEHGGSIDIVDFVTPGTRQLLEDPSLLLKDVPFSELPKLQGRVHCEAEDLLPLSLELVSRRICQWVELSAVHEVHGQKVLSGLFGVEKSNKLPDGRPHLRLIMNLVPINSILRNICGRVRNLPNITSWISLTSQEGEDLHFWQSDMCSAFYLFRVPQVWHKLLSFNVIFDGSHINLTPGIKYALCCAVLPMGWGSSVAVMQEVAEQVVLVHGLAAEEQISRAAPLPSFMTQVFERSEKELRPWWHVYLDNFCVGQRTKKGVAATLGTHRHDLAEDAWRRSGIVTSEKKRVSDADQVAELGAIVDSNTKVLMVSTERFLKNILGTLLVIGNDRLVKKDLQILGGRWIHALQFRRAAMCRLNEIWAFVGEKAGKSSRPFAVRRELLGLCLMAPLLHSYLAADISSVTSASDASMTGGAVGISRSLTTAGENFVRGARLANQDVKKIPVLVVSLFNGVGGAFRCYDILGVQPAGGIAVEIHGPSNRVTSRRWPYVKIVKDVCLVDELMVKEWHLEHCDIEEIHLWAGFPCVDLSAVRANRLGLQGPGSGLFYEIPRIADLLKKEFGEMVILKKLIENVASMDRKSCEEISMELGLVPYHLDAGDSVPMRRPRLCWCSEEIDAAVDGITITPEAHWRRVYAPAQFPKLEDWLSEGCTAPGLGQGHLLPTFMKSIRRQVPPLQPAGWARCDADTIGRWEADQMRFPPYQYREEFLVWNDNKWRLINSSERDLLMGYGWQHTSLCWSASDMKRDLAGYESERCSLMGDAFAIGSFVIPAAALCKKFLPKIHYCHLARRLGLAPGFRAPLRVQAPVTRSLSYGLLGGSDVIAIEDLHRYLLTRVNHTGSDIRISTGEIMNARAFPRQSVQADWWAWQSLFKKRWTHSDHINSLELRSILMAIKYHIQHLKACNMRLFHLSDSYVCISIIGKGRTGSKQLGFILKQLNSLLLLFNLQLVMGHVESTENPTDGASRGD